MSEYVQKRRKLSGLLFESALPNEYLVQAGARKLKPTLGGRRLRLFGLRKFLRIPASIQTIEFSTDNANLDFQGLGIDGFASYQINPENPEHAIRSLDLFDDQDPMARTNSELRLLCEEAVRHVIANMTIQEAMRKKEDIAEALKVQLKQVESSWGIVFHQVGIRRVRVMSAKLFDDLQARYRDELRLQAARTRISTDQQITSEENASVEKKGLERLSTEQKIKLQELENRTRARERELAEDNKLAHAEHETRSARIALEMELKLQAIANEAAARERELSEQARLTEAEHAANKTRLELEAALKRDQELPLLEISARAAKLQNEIDRLMLELERTRKEVEQMHSEASLTADLIVKLPDIARNMKIDNYTVFEGGGLTPLLRLVQEAFMLARSTVDPAAKPAGKSPGPSRPG